ncbi:MAG: DUF4956 domain-containing protein [Spirochaetales bacterium]|nr:DUF4956 domain-containing protein [Spirochaetales bacterium]
MTLDFFIQLPQFLCPELGDLILRFLVNMVFITILMITYYRVNNNSQYMFNFIVFNVLIFIISSFLGRIQLETGFAFGLFAIFSILRYRTEPVPIKEMTFMFTSIIIGTMNSTVTMGLSPGELLFGNVIVVVCVYIMEIVWLRKFKPSQNIIFERIDLIHEERRDELIQLLEERTGYTISGIKVNDIDFLKDTARLTIYME